MDHSCFQHIIKFNKISFPRYLYFELAGDLLFMFFMLSSAVPASVPAFVLMGCIVTEKEKNEKKRKNNNCRKRRKQDKENNSFFVMPSRSRELHA